MIQQQIVPQMLDLNSSIYTHTSNQIKFLPPHDLQTGKE